MGAAELRTFLREEFGIMNDEEFEAAVNASTGIDIGMFLGKKAPQFISKSGRWIWRTWDIIRRLLML